MSRARALCARSCCPVGRFTESGARVVPAASLHCAKTTARAGKRAQIAHCRDKIFINLLWWRSPIPFKIPSMA